MPGGGAANLAMAKILIVDDRWANRKFLVELLGHTGHHLLEARDGREALALAKAQRPDLVIADVIMPTMDGYELVRQLRAEPAIARTPVMFYTAHYLEAEARKLADACGVTCILTKPADPQEILKKVNLLLSGQAPVPVPWVSSDFERRHLCVLTNRLAEKVDELQGLNGLLERRFEARTAELAAANARLRDLTRDKDEAVATRLNELRSSLTDTLMMADRLRAQPASADELLAMLVSTTKRMMTLVDELLEVTKLQAGQPQSGPVDQAP
jgi:CheY-like chemotaxis protein